MPTWQEIGRNNFQAAVSLYDDGYYRSSTSRFYYAVFSVTTGELIQHSAAGDFTGGRGTPGHAQLSRLVELYFTHLSVGRLENLLGYVNGLYRDRITADYSEQRVDRQSATKTYRAAEKVFRYLEANL